MEAARFVEIIALRREQTGVEFKGRGVRSDSHFLAKVIRAVLSMANRRDGGVVVLGVDDAGGVLTPVGLRDDEISSWSYDEVADGFAEYADPSVSFELSVHEHDRKRFVVVEIEEFADVPVLCKKSHSNVLRKGACYVRTRRKPETAEIPSQAEMRDVLDLALEKRLRIYLRTAERAGARVAVPRQYEDAQRFAEEVRDLDE